MPDSANVRSFEAITRFRGAFAEFVDAGRLALTGAEADIQRTMWWLQQEALGHWQQQIRRRQQLVQQAKSELYRAQLGSRDERPSCAVERKALEKAERRLQEAEHKIERCKYWHRTLEREFLLYKGQTQSLGGLLDRDGPRAVARLGTMLDQLEKYVKTQPADSSGAAPAAETDAASDEKDEP